MPRVLIQTLTVPADAIDVNRHVNNLAYLGWMQEVAIEHSAAQGWPVTRYVETNTAWVVRSHFIEYLAPAFLGEKLTILTWVIDLKRQSSRRRYLFYRPGDGTIVAKAETAWVFVDGSTGRPMSIPEEVVNAFEIVPMAEDVLVSTGVGPANRTKPGTGPRPIP